MLDTVAVDSFQAAYDAVQYLVHTGHRRIALAYGREELYFTVNVIADTARRFPTQGSPMRRLW